MMKKTHVFLIILFLSCFMVSCTHMQSGRYYRIKRGDTPAKVAEKLNVSEKVVADASGGEFHRDKLIYINSARARKGMLDDLEPVNIAPRSRAIREEKTVVSSDPLKSGFILPLSDYVVTSRYGGRKGEKHDGVDLSGKYGSSIKAVADGVVVYSGNSISGYGNMVVVRHAGKISTVYAHNRRNFVQVGEPVKKGQVIASLGSTGKVSGPHLHFEVRKGAKAVNPTHYLKLD